MKTIIIEDEKPAARYLKRLLEELQVEVEACLHSVQESVNWFYKNPQPELIFLDIQLSDGLSFDIFKAVEVKSAIIFTTAYDEYALQAFKLNSIDYLLKPIDRDELKSAIKKYRQHHSVSPVLDFEEIKKWLSNPLERNYKQRFTVTTSNGIKIISASETVCFYSQNKATWLVDTSGRSYLFEKSLEALENELPPKDFFRINRKYCVNIKFIEVINLHTNSRLQLKLKHFSHEKPVVARERIKKFRLWLE